MTNDRHDDRRSPRSPSRSQQPHAGPPTRGPPTLSRHPPADAVATTKPVERWASLSPASTVVSVQDTGRTIQLDPPALVIEEIAGLLEGTP